MSLFDRFKSKEPKDQRYDVLVYFPKGYNIEIFYSDAGETIVRYNNVTGIQEKYLTPDSLTCNQLNLKKHYIV